MFVTQNHLKMVLLETGKVQELPKSNLSNTVYHSLTSTNQIDSKRAPPLWSQLV